MNFVKGLTALLLASSLILAPQPFVQAQSPAETVDDVQNVEDTTHQDDFTAAQLAVLRAAGVDMDGMQTLLQNMEVTADQMEKRSEVLAEILGKVKNRAAAEKLIEPEGARVEQALMTMLDGLEHMMELETQLDAAITANNTAQIQAVFPEFLDAMRDMQTQMDAMLKATNDAIAKLQAANLK